MTTVERPGSARNAPQQEEEPTEERQRHDSEEVDGTSIQTLRCKYEYKYPSNGARMSCVYIYSTALLEQEKQRIEELTVGWDDPTAVDWDNEEKDEQAEIHESSEQPPVQPVYKCTALYSYRVRTTSS